MSKVYVVSYMRRHGIEDPEKAYRTLEAAKAFYSDHPHYQEFEWQGDKNDDWTVFWHAHFDESSGAPKIVAVELVDE